MMRFCGFFCRAMVIMAALHWAMAIYPAYANEDAAQETMDDAVQDVVPEATSTLTSAELTAGTLYELCTDEELPHARALCQSYLAGEWELIQWMGTQSFGICPDQRGLSLELMRQLVIRHIENTGGLEHRPRPEAMIRAMRHYFPCSSKP